MAGVKGRSGGHNRKPAWLHQRQGTYRPGRHGRLTEPSPPPRSAVSLDPPGHLTGAAHAFWLELAPQLQVAGLLTPLDLPRLELLVVHLGHHRELYLRLNELLDKAKSSGTPMDTSRVSRSLRQEADVIRNLSVGFGLDPADRGRLPVRPIDPTENPLDKYINRPRSKWHGVLK